MMNGLSQEDREKRISELHPFAVIDGSMESLLQQAERVAGAIRYYNPDDNSIDGYFDQFLQDLNKIRQHDIERFVPDGNLEPAQALLFTFLKQLSETIGLFNRRWQEYPYHYLYYLLRMESLRMESHIAYLSFVKNTDEPLRMEKGLGFRLKDNVPDAPVYRLMEDTKISNTSIENIISIYFCKRENMYPASELGFVTSLNIKRLFEGTPAKGALFDDGRDDLKDAGELGFILTSPSLLLREGKRMVKIIFDSENGNEIREMLDEIVNTLSQQSSQSPEIIRYLILNNIFNLRFSVTGGWEIIENYSVKEENGDILLHFTLDRDFPETLPCQQDIHGFQSEFPALKAELNLDAWLYPFSWFNRCLLKRIHIRTEVEGISNVLVYNDLGKVDCSKPFQSFGINTEKGAWMVVGNYEMAVKNTQSIDLKIRWGQLPSNEDGFRGYYAGYGQGIDNTSFRVQAKYLSDYRWKEERNYPLFDVGPNTPLKKETVLHVVDTSKMPVITIGEEQYEYTINARTGFINLTLCSPEMGFGEKQYRTVFSDHVMGRIRHKKKKVTPNIPFSPVVEKLTLNYISEETIDFQKTLPARSEYYHITPLNMRKMYPTRNTHFIKPVFEMEIFSNLLILLKDLSPGGMLNLYIDFIPHKVEINAGQIPQLKLFLGNGYNWEPVSSGFIVEDKTMSLLVSGIIKINIPQNINSTLFDDAGRIWLRVGIEKNVEVIPAINKIHTHVAEVEFNPEAGESNYLVFLPEGSEWSPEISVAGLDKVFTVASCPGRRKESREEGLMRFSEYAGHRGKAVTARDYEQLILQAFPDIAKVKCLSASDVKELAKNMVTLVIIPRKTGKEDEEYWQPLATSYQILAVEQFLAGRASEYVHNIDVINPLYEEVLARCQIIFKKRYPEALCHTRISDLLDNLIAPWQKCYELPVFDYALDMEEIYGEILKQAFVEEIRHFSLVVISETPNRQNRYKLYEYGRDKKKIAPSTPYSVFAPSHEHILVSSDIENAFGINEMSIGNSFILPENTTSFASSHS